MNLHGAVLPDYGGANLANVVPALLERPTERAEWIPGPARDAPQVVLLVLDGLGWLQLQERLSLAPNLAEMTGGAITTVAPSTTATALTSLVVGAPPAAHGVVGYRLVVEGPGGREVMNVLKWRTPSGDARGFVDPHAFQALPPFRGHAVPVVSRAEFAGTGFTEAHQRGVPQASWHQVSSLAIEVRGLINAGEPLVYAYYDGIDRIAHIKGLEEHYSAELVAVDRLVADLLNVLPAGAALVVTSDHGQVEVGPRVSELSSRLLSEVAMQSGEARFRWLHAKDASDAGVERLAKIAEDLYGDEAWIATYDQAEDDGWFGGPLAPAVRARLGDVALLARDSNGYLDRAESSEHLLVCRHGSLTGDEMLVPLLAQRGRLVG